MIAPMPKVKGESPGPGLVADGGEPKSGAVPRGGTAGDMPCDCCRTGGGIESGDCCVRRSIGKPLGMFGADC